MNHANLLNFVVEIPFQFVNFLSHTINDIVDVDTLSQKSKVILLTSAIVVVIA